ncbi:MAG: DUF934 domain-containing protein [Rhizobiaceae bacterium]|jgi:uncharacterized protein (DUF934 family)|nr:DUF934 domain-containing protein [Rhizobiaceae bacterium]
MSIIVRDDGFHKDSWEADGGLFIDLEKFGQDVASKAPDKTALDIPNDVSAHSLTGLFNNVAMIRIPFPSFADGRGFSIAKQLRQIGYEGRLRAFGHVIADQYGFARTCGFDEVEISEELAERQPQEQWLARLPKDNLSYQKKLLAEREMRNA